MYSQKICIRQLNFWDFSGHPEFAEVRNEFYKEASLILLIFDLTVKRTLEALDMWLREANDYGAGALPVFLVGNKVIVLTISLFRKTSQEKEQLERTKE